MKNKIIFAPIVKISLVGLLCCVISIAAFAQNRDRDRDRDRYRDYESQERYDEERAYRYCVRVAEDETGYRGRRPSTYRRGQALEGAIRGATSASAASWITGGDKKERREAAKRGAVLGLIIGGIAQSQQRRRADDDHYRRREFQRELDRCMDYEYDRYR